MNSKRSSNESSRIDLLRSIANSVLDDEVYVPTDDELRTLGLDTRPRGKTAKCIVSGNHAAASVSWHVYEIEVPDFAPKNPIKLRYRTEGALDGPERVITGIGRLGLNGVGVNQSLLRKKLKEIWTSHSEDAISEDELSNGAPSQLDEIVSEVDEEQRWAAEEVAGHYDGPAGMPGVCDDHRIWLTDKDPWAGWSHTIGPIEELIPRNDAHLREDIKQAIKAAAQAAMDSTSHVETGGITSTRSSIDLTPRRGSKKVPESGK